MRILAIETSCDETGIAIVEGLNLPDTTAGTGEGFAFTVVSSALISQAALHAPYGGVYPNLAKREHEKNLPIILEQALGQAEPKLFEKIVWGLPEDFFSESFGAAVKESLKIDAIAVTQGPGLEPALWTGIEFAKKLAEAWQLPLLPTNHMEGHLLSSLIKNGELNNVQLPVLALLISGGHTEFVLMRKWFEYEIIGQTLDDALGEAFDKVARMLDLPYPGGPEISKLAERSRTQGRGAKQVDGGLSTATAGELSKFSAENLSTPRDFVLHRVHLPRPMIGTKDCDVSFSGLKTAVLYALRDRGGIQSLSADEIADFAREFEDAATDVLVHKTRRALEESGAQTFVIGGGVAANTHIRQSLEKLVKENFNEVEMRLPEIAITGDNAVMIAEAALVRALSGKNDVVEGEIRAIGNLSISAVKKARIGLMPEKFKAPYQPQEVEPAIYKKWEESGYFNPDKLPPLADGSERTVPFSIVLPPPNVTGTLHVGHAYEDTLQDIVIRFERMRGKKALWIPGTDSAAIATQARVEKNLQKEEGKTRHDLGREEMVRRVNEFAKKSESTILSQIRKMGASLDWSRYAYTLDDKRNLAVFTAFKRMYDVGLIYRGHRLVNWDPKGQTTISDDEIVHEERAARLVTFKYSKDFPIAIATTRLETKVGDTAVAVHPDDARYKEFVGREYDAVFAGVPIHIKIVADESVDAAFGTGALGVTPAHSQIDWDIAERHELPRPQVIDKYAKMIVAGPLNGKKVLEAREEVLTWLKENNLVIKEEDIPQNVSTSERTRAIIEPQIMEQWFIAVDKPFTIAHSEIPGITSGNEITLKQMMRAAVESGAVDMPQEGFRKTYFHWIDNLHDWCISRQIWFGHRIPVWYRGEEAHCGAEAPSGDGWVQDSDVLDTWFSSALWTFSTLGWPEETADLRTFHPTSFMSPAYEILQLWVSRMILMSGFHLGQVPFKKVIIHGLVRAKDGRKFSKSLNNGVDPLEIINKYGADALRMGLIVGSAIGSDIKFDEDKIKGYKHFANKIWNITRFVLENAAGTNLEAPYSQKDQERYNLFKETAVDITRDMEEYRIYMAAEKLYHYIWDIFAADLLEESKIIFKTGTLEEVASRKRVLISILRDSLKLLHPFMPFITEEIWGSLPDTSNLLMVEPWPLV